MGLPVKSPLIVKFLLLLMGIMSVMCTGAISPALPLMAKHFDYLPNSKFLVRLIVSAPHLMIGITSIFIGWILNYTDRILALITAMIVYSLAGSVCFFLEDIRVIIATRAILGICISIVLSASSTLTADIFDGKERSSALSLQTTFMSIGTITYSLISGFISDINWRCNFLLYLIPLFLIPFVIKYLYTLDISLKKPAARRKAAERQKDVGDKSRISQNNFLVAFIVLLGAFNMIMYYMIPLQLPFLMSSMADMNSKKISIALAIETLSSAIFALLYSKFNTSKQSFPITISIAFALCGASYLTLSNINSYALILLCSTIYGIGMGLVMPSLTLWLIYSVKPLNRGVVIGAFYSSLYTGKFFSSILIFYFSKLLNLQNHSDYYRVGSLGLFFMSIVLLSYGIFFRLRRNDFKIQV